MFLFLLIISIVPIALPVNAFANYVPLTLTNNQTKALLSTALLLVVSAERPTRLRVLRSQAQAPSPRPRPIRMT